MNKINPFSGNSASVKRRKKFFKEATPEQIFMLKYVESIKISIDMLQDDLLNFEGEDRYDVYEHTISYHNDRLREMLHGRDMCMPGET